MFWWPDCAQRQSWLLSKGNLQLWHGTPYEVQAHWASHGGSVLNCSFSTAIVLLRLKEELMLTKRPRRLWSSKMRLWGAPCHFSSWGQEKIASRAEEEGVCMFKDELRETVMKNQLGDFMHNESYLVSTLCDPRYIGLKVHRIWFSPTSLRHKDSFYLDEQTGQRARDLLVCLVEEQMEAGGANNNEQDVVQGEAWEEEEGSSSILHNMCKRIRRSRERHMEVVILMQLRCSLNYSAILIGPQDTGSSPASTDEAYLRLPLEEVKCLRYFIRKCNIIGFT